MKLTERQFVSEMRQRQLEHASETWGVDKAKILQYEEKFHRIQFLPIDSKLDEIPQEFIDFFYEKSSVSSSKFADYDKLYRGMYKTHSSDFTSSESIKNKEASTFDLHDMYSAMMQNITDGLPFEEIKSYTILSNNKPVPPHRDYYYYLSLPISFRVILHNENEVNTQRFYDYKPTDRVIEKESFSDYNSEDWDEGYTGRESIFDFNSSPFFTYNNLNTKHGADKVGQKRKIVVVVKMTNIIDWDKLDEIMMRSEKRFGHQGMFTSDPREEYFDL